MSLETQVADLFIREWLAGHWRSCIELGLAALAYKGWTRALYAAEGWRRERERNSQREIATLHEKLNWQSEKSRELLDVFMRGPVRTLELPPEDSSEG